MKKRTPTENPFDTFFQMFLSLIYLVLFLCFVGLIYGFFGDAISKWFETPPPTSETRRSIDSDDDWDRVENGIHVQSGLVYAKGFDEVRGVCTACHSAKLVTQNRATREGWKDMIRWMQKTQGLWDLGTNEPIILDYLAKHYAPQEIERRPGLDMAEIEWYILEIE